MTRPTSRVEMAARLLDTCARISFRDFKMYLSLYTHDVTWMDAFIRLCGKPYRATKRASGTGRLLRCGNEVVLRKVLRECLPFMRERQALIAAALRFLEAETAEEMLQAIREVQEEMYRWPARGG